MVAPGRIRPEVRVTTHPEADRIRFSHWELALPAGFIAGNAGIHRVLCGQASVFSVPPQSPEGQVLALLRAQGCFSELGRDDPCTLRELRRHFDKLRSLWYSQYYAHPLWPRLRAGLASRNELVSWLVHNYHVSRIAGPVAARCAVSAHANTCRDRFLRDTLDEFWHADAFYFVRHRALSMSDEHLKAYVPLPATRAFELHTLQTAERNPLGHTLIAYFQESTVHFFEDCVKFYSDVERSYGLDGFFEAWKRHMRIDLDESHAAGVSSLLDSDEVVSSSEREAALRAAWLAHSYLYDALDDIRCEERAGSEVELRQPEDWKQFLEGRAICSAFSEEDVLNADLVRCFHSGALDALAHTVVHDQITAIGVLARCLDDLQGTDEAWRTPLHSKWMEALQNQLRERADPEFLAHAMTALCSEWRKHTGRDLVDERVEAALQRLHRVISTCQRPSWVCLETAWATQFLGRAFRSPLLDPSEWLP